MRPVAGRLPLAFLNVEAYAAFDPDDPNATRWLEEDMNRVWEPSVLDGARQSVELARARAVRPALEDVDLLLDLHSLQHLAPPLALGGRHAKGAALAGAVGVPPLLVQDAGHAAGRRMRDYGGFDDPASAKAALLIECGQHWEAGAALLAEEAARRFLVAAGVADPAMIEAYPRPAAQERWRVAEAVTIQAERFAFKEPYLGGEVIAKAGTVIGWDGAAEVRTPADDMMLVMPSKRLWAGQTAVRLALREV